MRSFGERNPVIIAVIGIVALVLIGVAAFYANDLPFIGGGTDYSANFTDAAGLRTNDDVRIAGVKVGAVESIALAGDHVHVAFSVKDAWVGDQSTAAVKIKTLLGQEYIAIDPLGDRPLDSHTPIPITRTTTPISVSAALNGLSSTVGSIDTTQLAKSFDVLSAAFADTPRSVHAALVGLSALSRTISSRNVELKELAANTAAISSTLASSNAQFTALINDGSLLLQELQARSAAITALLHGTEEFATQVAGLVHDNNDVLGPALAQLSKVSHILDTNRSHLQEALRLIGPYYTLLGDATGSGRWVDIYLCGLFTANDVPELDSTALRNCTPRAGQ
jgi:phospholipid/cholesterol/gamma-HCH transport system substrate-binding protein